MNTTYFPKLPRSLRGSCIFTCKAAVFLLHIQHCFGQVAGSLDPGFVPQLGDLGGVESLTLQADGRVVVSGGRIPGSPEGLRLLRLLPDGSSDPAAPLQTAGMFTQGMGSVAVQPDGKLITMDKGGQPFRRLVRFMADGSVESPGSFHSASIEGGDVTSFALQPDGKILIGGMFSAVDGQPRSRLARLMPDGDLEPLSSFNPSNHVSVDGGVLYVQEDGKVVVAGFWKIVRLNGDGSLDAVLQNADVESACLTYRPDGTFFVGGRMPRLAPFGQTEYFGMRRLGVNPGVFFNLASDSTVISMGLQVDGRLIVGGNLAATRFPNALIRFRADGTEDSLQDFPVSLTAVGARVKAVAIAADGKILFGGEIATINGQPRKDLARIFNDPATQTLAVTGDGSAIQWLRGGSAPEVSLVTFERSTDAGQSWTLLGRGVRVAGGWEITGLAPLPEEAAIRARGRTGDGRSTGLVEQVINIPEIAVEFPAGTDLLDGSPRTLVDYGPAPAAGLVRTLTVRNAGTVPLTNFSATFTGAHAGDFAVTSALPATLIPGATATLGITFTPGGAGPRTATLRLASNDPDESPFDIALTGRAATPSEAWRLQYFNTPENTGDAADLADPDGDGQENLIEYATRGHPRQASPPPGVLVKNGGTLEFTYTRPTAAVPELTWRMEASTNLATIWSSTGFTTTIENDDGVTQTILARAPAGSLGKRFVRLRVTRN